jgi:hypothetical protein
MDQNIQWTAALGAAYYNQPQDVLQAIQFMRQRAQAAGNLQTTPQQAVSYDQGNIEVMPSNPQVVYVPAYNPWTAYGQPVSPYPGFSLLGAIGSFFNSSIGSSAIQFGLGTVMSAFSSTPWGLLSWGLNWLTQSLLFNHSDYYSNSHSVADWGLRYGGPRAWMRPHSEFAGYHRGFDHGYNRGYGRSYDRGFSGSQNGIRQNNNRGYGSSGYGFNRNQQANRGFQQSYARTNYGSRQGWGNGTNYRNGLYTRQQSPYAGRSGVNNNRSFQAYSREPMAGRSQQYLRSAYGSNHSSAFGAGGSRGGFNQRSNSFSGSGFSGSPGKTSHSGGFHLFGGNHNSNSFGGGRGYKAPHYKAPKMHGGGFGGGGHHSFGGGHHSSGGGHSHGGGHHH